MSVEVMLAREPRRRWSEAAKARILDEALAPGAVVAEVARRHRVSSSLIFTWRSRMGRPTGPGPASRAVQGNNLHSGRARRVRLLPMVPLSGAS
jgi:transposase-like protein